MHSIPGSGRGNSSFNSSTGGGNGNPFQYSFLENPHGQRSPVSYSPQRHRQSDTTEHICACTHTHTRAHTHTHTHTGNKKGLLWLHLWGFS